MFISEYFMKQQRSQYAGEGYIVSVLCLLASLSFLFFTRLDSLLRLKGETRGIVLCVLLLLGYLFVQVFLLCYRIKTPWYNTSFLPPQDYMRGPLARDQGTNI